MDPLGDQCDPTVIFCALLDREFLFSFLIDTVASIAIEKDEKKSNWPPLVLIIFIGLYCWSSTGLIVFDIYPQKPIDLPTRHANKPLEQSPKFHDIKTNQSNASDELCPSLHLDCPQSQILIFSYRHVFPSLSSLTQTTYKPNFSLLSMKLHISFEQSDNSIHRT